VTDWLLWCSLLMSPLTIVTAQEAETAQRGGEEASDADSPFGDLLEGLSEPQAAPTPATPAPAASPLDGAYQAMRRAQQRLESGTTDVSAVEAQQAAIESIDALLQQVQQPQAAPPPPPEEASSDEAAASEPQAGETSPPESEDGSPPEQGSASAAAGEVPSNDSLMGAAETEAATLRPSLQQAVWGHLPDRVRQQLQASMPEEFHPRYKQAINDYFRQLSQPSAN